MNNSEATEKFQESQRLYDAGRYSEALTILNELGDAFPGTKNILYPRARCLYKLDRLDEARYVAELLIDKFADSRAEELLLRIKDKQAPPPAFNAAALGQAQVPQGQPPQAPPMPGGQPPPVPQDPMAGIGQVADPMDLGGASPIADILGEDVVGPGFDANDSVFGAQPQPAGPPPPSLQPESNTKKYVLWGVGALLLLGLIGPLIYYGTRKTQSPTSPVAEGEAAPEGTAPSLVAESLPLSITWQPYTEETYYEIGNGMAPVLLYFSSPTSDDCTKVEEQIFEEPSVIGLMDQWRFVRVNIDEVFEPVGEYVPDPVDEYMVDTAPTIVIFDRWGGVAHRQEGYTPARDFYTALQGLNLDLYEAPEIPEFSVAAALFFIFLALVAPMPCLYVALLLGGKLPYNELGKDFLHISGTIFIAYLISIIPCVGGFIAFYFIITRYQMEIVDDIVYIAMSVGVEFVLMFFMALSLGIPPALFFEIVFEILGG